MGKTPCRDSCPTIPGLESIPFNKSLPRLRSLTPDRALEILVSSYRSTSRSPGCVVEPRDPRLWSTTLAGVRMLYRMVVGNLRHTGKRHERAERSRYPCQAHRPGDSCAGLDGRTHQARRVGRRGRDGRRQAAPPGQGANRLHAAYPPECSDAAGGRRPAGGQERVLAARRFECFDSFFSKSPCWRPRKSRCRPATTSTRPRCISAAASVEK